MNNYQFSLIVFAVSFLIHVIGRFMIMFNFRSNDLSETEFFIFLTMFEAGAIVALVSGCYAGGLAIQEMVVR